MKDWILLIFACFPGCILWIEIPGSSFSNAGKNTFPQCPPPPKKEKKKSKKVSLDVTQSHPLHRTHFRTISDLISMYAGLIRNITAST